MFLVNSRLGHFSATSSRSYLLYTHDTEVPLLPKLRGHFAEFLNEGSLARLRILSLPTCVGLRYGHPFPSLETFLDSLGSVSSLLLFRSPSPLRPLVRRFCLSHTLLAWTHSSNRALNLPSCVIPSSSG